MKYIILAGGEAPQQLISETIKFRHQLTFQGRSFLEIAVSAVKNLGDVVVVGEEVPEGIESCLPGQNFLGSLMNGLNSCASESDVAVLSADLPFLTEAAIKDFIDNCDPTAGLNYSIARIEDVDRAYPGMSRTELKVREGRFTGGNIAVLNRQKAMDQLPLIQELYDARKSPLKIAQKLGIGMLFAVVKVKVAPNSVGINEFEHKLSKVLGLKVRGIISNDPSLAADVDNSSHYAWLKTLEKLEE